MDPEKEVRADAKLQNLPQEDLDFLWGLRYPERGGGKKMTLSAIALQVPLRYGFDISLSSLSGFYRWLKLRRRWQESETVAALARAELAKDPDISDEELDKFSERVLKVESATKGDVKGYVALGRLKLSRSKQEFDRDKLSQASKSAIEKGLDALYEEIKGSAKAVAAFEVIKREVAK